MMVALAILQGVCLLPVGCASPPAPKVDSGAGGDRTADTENTATTEAEPDCSDPTPDADGSRRIECVAAAKWYGYGAFWVAPLCWSDGSRWGRLARLCARIPLRPHGERALR